MKQSIIVFIGLLAMSFIFVQEPSFELKGDAPSKKYGWSKKEPIKVGGGNAAKLPFEFAKHLKGPNGEPLEAIRVGDCVQYKDPDPSLTHKQMGTLTCYRVNYKGFKKPQVLYFDKYRTGDLYIPQGLSWKE